jgi:Zn ribbon nucleic-acid-binding protein
VNAHRPNLLNHRLADGVRRVGFRKWYERELLSSHAHMVLTLLASIAMIASFEAFRGASVPEKLMNVGFVIVSALIGLWALRRYLFLLMRAEYVANQANCPACSEYGRFEVIADNQDQTRVRCRKCAHEWIINSDT